jgi:hypothetical protein
MEWRKRMSGIDKQENSAGNTPKLLGDKYFIKYCQDVAAYYTPQVITEIERAGFKHYNTTAFTELMDDPNFLPYRLGCSVDFDINAKNLSELIERSMFSVVPQSFVIKMQKKYKLFYNFNITVDKTMFTENRIGFRCWCWV